MNGARVGEARDPMARISPNQFGWGLVILLAALVGVFHRDLLQANREPDVVLSEILAVNHSALDDADGDFPGWIELHNRSLRPVNLGGWHLTDDFRNPTRWTFPPVTLDPGAFLVVFASGKDRTNRVDDLHANFRLDPKGRFLGLARPGGTLFEDEFQPRYPALPGDVSFGVLEAGLDSPFHLRRHGLFVTPTPGETNRGEMLGQVADTRFSQPRGFQDQPFDLTIECRTPDSEIRYTLDGSLPRQDHGAVYSRPIPITNTTVVRAAAFRPGFRPSNVDTLTFLFPSRPGQNSEASSASAPGRSSPSPLPPKATLRSLPIVSLVLDPADLWDPTRGLQTNPTETGSAWERVASMEWIESGFSGNRSKDRAAFCGIRIQDPASVTSPLDAKHSFRLVFRDLHGTPEWSGHPLGPTGPKRFKTLLLNAGFPTGGRLDLIQDAFLRETLAAMDPLAPVGRFVHLLLNGRYWGVYDLCERTDSHLLADRLGGKPSSYEIRSPEKEPSEPDASWNRMIELCRLGLSDPDRYREMEMLVDLEAFADFVVLHLHTGTPDDRIGTRWIAGRRTEPRQGAWMFLPGFGISSGTGSDGPEVDTGLSPATLLQSLRAQPEFIRLLETRTRKHLAPGGALSPEAIQARRSDLVETLGPALEAEAVHWGGASR